MSWLLCSRWSYCIQEKWHLRVQILPILPNHISTISPSLSLSWEIWNSSKWEKGRPLQILYIPCLLLHKVIWLSAERYRLLWNFFETVIFGVRFDRWTNRGVSISCTTHLPAITSSNRTADQDYLIRFRSLVINVVCPVTVTYCTSSSGMILSWRLVAKIQNWLGQTQISHLAVSFMLALPQISPTIINLASNYLIRHVQHVIVFRIRLFQATDVFDICHLWYDNFSSIHKHTLFHSGDSWGAIWRAILTWRPQGWIGVLLVRNCADLLFVLQLLAYLWVKIVELPNFVLDSLS